MSKTPRLVFCDETCVIRGKSYQGLPLLVDVGGAVVWSVSDYLRKRMCAESLDRKTVESYAGWLRQWWEFLGRKSVAWDYANDALLEEFRNEQDSDPNVSGATCNEKLRIIYLFYLWAQNNGYVFRIIGQVDRPGGVPPFPISIGARHKKRRNGSGGDLSLVMKFPIRSRRTKQKKAIVLPADEHVDLHYSDIVSHEYTGSTFAYYISVRDALIFDWMEQVGLRRMEVANLTLRVLPSEDVVNDNDYESQVCLVRIVGKFKKERMAEVSPELVRRTRYFIEQERAEFIMDKQKKGVLNNSDYIFLSATTGERINPKSISNAFLERANRLGIRLHPHLLRHKAITRRTEFALAELSKHEVNNGAIYSVETALIQTAESTGWDDIHGMANTYVHLAKRANRAELDADKNFVDNMAMENLRRENEILRLKLNRERATKK